jgi:4-amino-4-deoxy-L-arabinose transferase-like glycosyltransferase
MDAGIPAEFLEHKYVLWVIGAVGGVLFLTTNLPWQLDDYDQAKQAFTSFEMIKEGHWFYQRTPHERVTTKPPLVGWISAATFAMTRSWDIAWRLPSLLAALAISVMLFRAAASFERGGSFRLFPQCGGEESEGSSTSLPIFALIATSAFVFNLLSPRLATLVRTDMPLTLVIFAIGLLIWEKIREREQWHSRDRLWIFALLTAAMLIKGPIVYAFLLPGILAFELCGGRPHGPSRIGISQPSAWCAWWPWLASLGIFLVWVINGSIFVPGFFNQVVMREFLARFGETVHRPQPLLFYLPHLLHKFFPWSVLTIALAIIDLRARQWKIGAALREMAPATVWLVCWIFGGLIVMSIIPSKRVDRVFPIIPPLCLLLAVQIGRSSTPFRHGSACRVRSPSMSSDIELTDHPPPQSFGEASSPLATGNEMMRARVLRWSLVALLASILFASSYTVAKIVSGYRVHRDALVSFGQAVRAEAAAHQWRYEVLKTGDEGLLLYLERTHFIEPQRAIAEWNRGNLDAVVAPVHMAPSLMRDLHDAALSRLKSTHAKGESDNYALITR